jgi:hypothetical protein
MTEGRDILRISAAWLSVTSSSSTVFRGARRRWAEMTFTSLSSGSTAWVSALNATGFAAARPSIATALSAEFVDMISAW